MSTDIGRIYAGAAATIVDMATTLAVMSLDTSNRGNASAEINLSFLSPYQKGRPIILKAQVDRMLPALAFTQCWLYNEKNELLVSGRHSIAFLDYKFSLDTESDT